MAVDSIFFASSDVTLTSGILTPLAKYQVDRTAGGEVMGIFRQQRN